jgi:hypothetical protein
MTKLLRNIKIHYFAYISVNNFSSKKASHKSWTAYWVYVLYRVSISLLTSLLWDDCSVLGCDIVLHKQILVFWSTMLLQYCGPKEGHFPVSHSYWLRTLFYHIPSQESKWSSTSQPPYREHITQLIPHPITTTVHSSEILLTIYRTISCHYMLSMWPNNILTLLTSSLKMKAACFTEASLFTYKNKQCISANVT